MKKTFIITIAVIAFISCKKSDNPPLSSTPPTAEDLYDNIKAAHQSPLQSFTIDALVGGTITGSKGTTISFPPHAFVNVPTGNVYIKLRESLTKDAWLMDGLSTIADDNRLLQSGGMIKIDATDDAGRPADLDPELKKPGSLDSVVRVEMPKPVIAPNVDMQLWQGDINQPWTAALYYPFGSGPNSYIFQLPGFTWVNCDGLYTDPRPKTTVKVIPDFSALAGPTDVQVFFVYRNINTCITLPLSAGYWESYQNSIPEGSVADVVILGKAANGQVIFKVMNDVQFTSLMNINITPELSTNAAVSAYLNTIK